MIEPEANGAGAAWLGRPPNWRQVTAAFWVGTVGVEVAGLQPVMLGSLEAAGRITAAQLGHAATLELLTLGLGAAIGSTLLEGRSLRLTAMLAGLFLAAFNLLTLRASGELLTLVRGLAGLPGGVMIWVTTAFIVRAPTPARWSGAYLFIQAVAQLVIASAAAAWAPGDTAFAPLAMAAMGALAVLTAPLLPGRLERLPRQPGETGLPPLSGWAALGACMLLQACIVGAWVYAEPLGRSDGLPGEVVALAAPVCLAAQLVGSAAAMWLASRLRWFVALAASCVLLVVTLLGLAAPQPAFAFLGLQAVFGALWMFATPFVTPLLIESDPTRRAALLGPAANLLGAASGPLAASALVGEGDARAALHLCAWLAAAALGLVAALHVAHARRPAPVSP